MIPCVTARGINLNGNSKVFLKDHEFSCYFGKPFEFWLWFYIFYIYMLCTYTFGNLCIMSHHKKNIVVEEEYQISLASER